MFDISGLHVCACVCVQRDNRSGVHTISHEIDDDSTATALRYSRVFCSLIARYYPSINAPVTDISEMFEDTTSLRIPCPIHIHIKLLALNTYLFASHSYSHARNTHSYTHSHSYTCIHTRSHWNLHSHIHIGIHTLTFIRASMSGVVTLTLASLSLPLAPYP